MNVRMKKDSQGYFDRHTNKRHKDCCLLCRHFVRGTMVRNMRFGKITVDTQRCAWGDFAVKAYSSCNLFEKSE